MSDYRFRGISLSAGNAAPQIGLGYDNPSGWYAGAFASKVSLREVDSNAQLTAYGGYSRRLESGLGWELGVTRTEFVPTPNYRYSEVFAGLSSDSFNARIYFSPNYFGQSARSIYAELNGAYPIRERLRLLGHIGYLRTFSDNEYLASYAATRFDTRVGVGAGIANWEFNLAWVAIERSRAKYRYGDRDSPTLVLSASCSF